jgi:hypothetical protein
VTEGLTAAELLQRAHALSQRLEGAGIWNQIRLFREDGITVLARVPGEYWEIDLLEDGTTDVEVFRTAGDLEDESSIERLISEFGEKPKH